MKRLLLITVCAVLFSLVAFAQDQQQEYDTVVYFPATILQCPMLFDTAANRQYYNNCGYDTLSPTGWFLPDYHSFGRLDYLELYCNEDVPGQYGRGLAKVVGHTTIYDIRSFAQPYSLPDLDTSAILIGVAAKIYGERPPTSIVPYFVLYDYQGNMVDRCAILHMSPDGANRPYVWENRADCELKYYIFEHEHKMQVFSLAYDKNHTYYGGIYGNIPYEFDHTMAFEGGDPKVPYHHICAYEDKGCYEYIPPFYRLYDSTEWVRFDNDSLYSYYHKMQIGFYPIFLMPKSSSGLSETELSQHCNLVPNPASTRCKVISRYKLQEVEVYDMGGRRIMNAKTNGYEHFFDVSAFEKGTYIVVISTDVGKTSKQLIVN